MKRKTRKQNQKKKEPKKASKFKQRIKNFFKIPEEVFEEEPSPQFERQKLFTLNRKNIFLGLALFTLIINLLIFFDFNILYLRQILGFLFLVSVPGIIIMLCFKIRNIGFWGYLVYTVGLSISFIMFAGLIVNWVLPWIGITDKPLSLYPILICFDIFLIVLGSVAYKRNKDFKPKPFTLLKLDRLNNIFFTIPMIFPVLSILGAFFLNNHGPNILTMIMLGSIAVYIILLTIFRKKLDKNIWPWALYWISLALIYTGSMRGWFISGSDQNTEHQISLLTNSNALWSANSTKYSYNFMLSVSLLPSIISSLSNMEISYILRIYFPLLFSIVGIIIFLLVNKLAKNSFISYLSGLFFIAQPTFTSWDLLPARQEIAFIFLALMFLVMFNQKLREVNSKIFLLTFGVSMILSHYSTAYIALLTLILFYLLNFFTNISKRKSTIWDDSKYVKKIILTGSLIVLLLLFGFLWYNQVTPVSEGLIDFTHESLSNFNHIFGEDLPENAFWKDILPFVNRTNTLTTSKVLENYNQNLINSLSRQEGDDALNKIKGYSVYEKFSSYKTGKFKGIFAKIYPLQKFLVQISVLFVFIGLVILLKIKGFKNYFLFALSSFLLLFTIFLPFSSSSYGVDRLYQQLLMILSFPFVIGFQTIVSKFTHKNYILLTIFIIFYLIIFTNILFSLIGGPSTQIRFDNYGKEYDLHYVSFYEANSNYWSINNILPDEKLYLDKYTKFKIFSTKYPILGRNYDQNIFPSALILDKTSYVYAGRTNILDSLAFGFFGNYLISYNFPNEFLRDNKNKIYSNGGSGIFK